MSYSFMNHEQLGFGWKSGRWASELGVIRSLVVESGAAPLARLCQEVAKARKLQLQWYFIKIPRDIHLGWSHYFQYGLEYDAFPEDFKYGGKRADRMWSRSAIKSDLCFRFDYFEFGSDGGLLEILDRNVLAPSFQRVKRFWNWQVKPTIQDLERPFAYFDETLIQEKLFFKRCDFWISLARSLSLRLFHTWLRFLRATFLNGFLSLYASDSEEESYQKGVYPFENRLDWIGYYYWNHEAVFAKTTVASLIKKDLALNFDDIRIRGL